MSFLFFDTETTGTPEDYNAPATDTDNWPRVVQLAWARVSTASNSIERACSYIIQPDGFTIPYDAWKVHGISTTSAHHEGHPLQKVTEAFLDAVRASDALVAHNVGFDLPVVHAELYRQLKFYPLDEKPTICTMKEATEYCELPHPWKLDEYKWPKLQELHEHLFGKQFKGAHDAKADVRAGARCFLELVERGVIEKPTINDHTTSSVANPFSNRSTASGGTFPF